MRQLCLLLLLLSGGCTSSERDPAGVAKSQTLSVEEVSAMQTTRVFFGHQSVGRDILAEIAEFAPDLRVVTAADPDKIEGPALIEASIESAALSMPCLKRAAVL